MKPNKSRTALSAVNILSGFANRLLTSLLKLLGRIVFFRLLSAELYGVSGLFSNVLGLLSFAELGIGTAITFSLYRPIVDKDEEKIASLMRFYRIAYRSIALVVLVAGLGLMPFLTRLIHDYQGIDYFYWIYLLFLFNMVIDYLFSYKRTLAVAYQEGFRLVPFTTGGEALTCLLQIAVLFLFSHERICFLLYLAVQTVCLLLQNIAINRYLDKTYPVLTKTALATPLPKEERRDLFVNVKALIYHKIGTLVVAGTDNLLISKLIGLVAVGLYSNYNAMIVAVSGIVYLFAGNTTASFGNLIASETPEKRRAVFEEAQFFYFSLYGIGCAFFLTAFQPFISLAYGEAFCLEFPVVVLVVVSNFYLLGITYVLDVVKGAAGLYDKDKWLPLVQSAVNLAVSIVLGKRLGLVGIFWGTFVSTFIPLIGKPVILYKYVFSSSPVPYFRTLLFELFSTAVMCAASLGACRLLPALSPLFTLILNLAVTALVSFGVFFLLHARSPYLPALRGRVKGLIRRKGD